MYQQGLWFVYSSIGQIPSKPSYKRTLFKYHVGIFLIPSTQKFPKIQKWKIDQLIFVTSKSEIFFRTERFGLWSLKPSWKIFPKSGKMNHSNVFWNYKNQWYDIILTVVIQFYSTTCWTCDKNQSRVQHFEKLDYSK